MSSTKHDSPSVMRLPFIEGDALTAAIGLARVILADCEGVLEVVHGRDLVEAITETGDQDGVTVLEIEVQTESDLQRLAELITRLKFSTPEKPALTRQTAK